MASPREFLKRLQLGTGVVCVALGMSACTDRLEPPVPQTYLEVETMRDWAETRAESYGIPQRSLEAYAYAAFRVREDSGCQIGWPTIAALGYVLSDHGRAKGASVGEDGVTSKPLRRVAPAAEGKEQVSDTDAGEIDGTREIDVPVGPFQIMPSRWEEFGTAVEPGATPNPDNIDDAALTTAKMLCSTGDMKSPDGWTAAVSSINPSPIFLKGVHSKAEEYSR